MSALLLLLGGTSGPPPAYTERQELSETFTGNSTNGDVTVAGRADTGWTILSGTGQFNVQSGVLQMATNGTGGYLRNTTALDSDDQYAAATFTHDLATATSTGLLLRADAVSLDRYMFHTTGTGTFDIRRYIGTASVLLESVTVTRVGSGVAFTMEFQAIGNTLIGYYNGTEVVRVTDATPLTSGGRYAGIRIFSNTTLAINTVDNWSAGAVAVSDLGNLIPSSFFFAA